MQKSTKIHGLIARIQSLQAQEKTFRHGTVEVTRLRQTKSTKRHMNVAAAGPRGCTFGDYPKKSYKSVFPTTQHNPRG